MNDWSGKSTTHHINIILICLWFYNYEADGMLTYQQLLLAMTFHSSSYIFSSALYMSMPLQILSARNGFRLNGEVSPHQNMSGYVYALLIQMKSLEKTGMVRLTFSPISLFTPPSVILQPAEHVPPSLPAQINYSKWELYKIL